MKWTLAFLSLLMLAVPSHAALKAGDKVPDFSAPLSDGTTFHLSEWLTKAPLVIYFYPKDNTPGCTTEACGLRDDMDAFRDLGATVVGSSYDTIKSHKKFISDHNLPFPLISDRKKEVAKAFGVDRAMFAERATFILDKDGTVLYANPSVSPKKHSAEIRAELKKFKR